MILTVPRKATLPHQDWIFGIFAIHSSAGIHVDRACKTLQSIWSAGVISSGRYNGRPRLHNEEQNDISLKTSRPIDTWWYASQICASDEHLSCKHVSLNYRIKGVILILLLSVKPDFSSISQNPGEGNANLKPKERVLCRPSFFDFFAYTYTQ